MNGSYENKHLSEDLCKISSPIEWLHMSFCYQTVIKCIISHLKVKEKLLRIKNI